MRNTVQTFTISDANLSPGGGRDAAAIGASCLIQSCVKVLHQLVHVVTRRSEPEQPVSVLCSLPCQHSGQPELGKLVGKVPLLHHQARL